MFDVGFSEMIVIAVVALVVIGPEKLPRVARTVGALLGRMQRYVNDVKADINREIELDELKKMHTSVKEAAQSIETSMKDAVSSFEQQGQEMNAAIGGDAKVAAETEAAAPSAQMSDADLAAAIQAAQDQVVAESAPASASAAAPTSDADLAATIQAAQEQVPAGPAPAVPARTAA
jgi:sec-independent protein translocase protein TatB